MRKNVILSSHGDLVCGEHCSFAFFPSVKSFDSSCGLEFRGGILVLHPLEMFPSNLDASVIPYPLTEKIVGSLSR